MTDNHVGFKLQEIQQATQSAEMCGCATPTCTNQTHYGTEDTTRVLHAKYHHIVSHPSNCKVTPSRAQVKGTIRTNVRSMCMCLPPPLGYRSAFMRDVTAHVTALMSRTRAPVRVRRPGKAPPYTVTPTSAQIRDMIRDMKRSVPNLRCIFLDKNAWCFTMCCALFWMKVLFAAYNRTEYVQVRQYASATECQTVLFLHYYFLALALPPMRQCYRKAPARRRLVRALPWAKGLRIPDPPVIHDCINTEEKARVVRDRLLQLAEATCQDLAKKSGARHTGSPYTLHLPNNTTHQTTPSTACSAKNKSIPVPPEGEMATREMFSHANAL